MEPLTILAVDDDLIERKIFSMLFRNDYALTLASTTEEGIELLSRFRYNLLITDLNVPTLGGIALLTRARLLNPEMPCIVVSAFIEGDDREWLIDHRVDFMEKPYHVPSLFALVKDTLRATG